jgi:hypothetical protein
VLGGSDDAVSEIRDMDPKIQILGHHPDLGLFEGFTLLHLWTDAFREDFEVLYLHTKGVSYQPIHTNVEDWIKYMLYFLVEKHETCLDLLKENDAVGVNLRKSSTCGTIPHPLHYSGNFWWSSSRHIKRLDPTGVRNKYAPEMWVTSHEGARYRCLWESRTNLYCQPYPRSQYAL